MRDGRYLALTGRYRADGSIALYGARVRSLRMAGDAFALGAATRAMRQEVIDAAAMAHIPMFSYGRATLTSASPGRGLATERGTA